MEETTTKTVNMFGREERVGDWVVIDPSLTKILAEDATPEAALKKAGIDLGKAERDGARPVLMQVPDPSLTCLY